LPLQCAIDLCVHLRSILTTIISYSDVLVFGMMIWFRVETRLPFRFRKRLEICIPATIPHVGEGPMGMHGTAAILFLMHTVIAQQVVPM
jgi:hypothetical protein